MRVLFLTVIPSPYQRETFAAIAASGGLEASVMYYAAHAADRQWRSGRLAPYETILSGITLSRLGDFAHVNPGVVSAVRRTPAEVVVVSDYSAPTAQIVMRWLNLTRRRWMFWGELPGFAERGRLGLWARRRLQAPLRGAAAIAAIGTRAEAAYRSLFPGKPVFNIPYFCDLSPFAAAAEQAKAPSPWVNVLFSGQLIERKGVDLLIEAFAHAAASAPRLRLLLLGGGPERNRFAAMVPDDLAHRVEFLGYREPDELPQIFAQADVFCLPSRHDGWGVVVNEALGAGLPIIVSDRVGAGGDLVGSGMNGRIVPAGEIEPLTAALREFADDETRRKAAAASRALAAQWGLDEGVRRWRRALEAMA